MWVVPAPVFVAVMGWSDGSERRSRAMSLWGSSTPAHVEGLSASSGRAAWMSWSDTSTKWRTNDRTSQKREKGSRNRWAGAGSCLVRVLPHYPKGGVR